MRKTLLSLSLLTCFVGLTGSVTAQLSAIGTGGLIPDTGTGGGGVWAAPLPATTLPAVSTTSTASISIVVTRVNSILVQGLTHTFIGDLQMTLRDPDGVEHNIFLRPGMGNGNSFGQAGDMLLGDWTFVQCGASDLPDCGFTVCGNNDVPSGTYNQTFFTGAYLWPDGNLGIFNTDMCSITGPAGDWELVFYDWAGGDGGSFDSWTMNFNASGCGLGCSSPFADSCNGDGGDQLGCTDCPCGNNTPMDTVGGCINSSNNGTRLLPSGDPSISLPSGETTDLRFGASGAPANSFCILNSGDGLAPGNMANPCFGTGNGAQAAVFDGLRCAVANTLRHGGRSADVNGDVGVTNNPWGGEGGPPVGIAQQGAGFSIGQTRYFQIIHRDDPLAVCTRGLNTSQAVEVVFLP